MKLASISLLALAAFGAGESWAAATTTDVPSAVSTRITALLKERYPDVAVEQIHRAPLPGVYEVLTPQEMVYVDEGVNYVFVGRLVDAKTHADLSQASWVNYRSIDFSTLPLDLAMKTVRGDGSRKLAIFADPLCPFCKQLEQQMQGVTNVTIYTFLFPLESIHPGATEKARRIWCSKDAAAAWSAWMVKEAEPAAAPSGCDTSAITKVLAQADKFHLNSTPTLFFGDGKRAEGNVSTADLEQALASVKR